MVKWKHGIVAGSATIIVAFLIVTVVTVVTPAADNTDLARSPSETGQPSATRSPEVSPSPDRSPRPGPSAEVRGSEGPRHDADSLGGRSAGQPRCRCRGMPGAAARPGAHAPRAHQREVRRLLRN